MEGCRPGWVKEQPGHPRGRRPTACSRPPRPLPWPPQLLREPGEVAKARKAAAEEANAARKAVQREKAEEKAKMKGKNKPSRRQRKKQLNIIEDKKPAVLARMREEEERKRAAAEAEKEQRLAAVPRALQRFAR
jgi:U3 small nucleolar RNA-associated protein 7